MKKFVSLILLITIFSSLLSLQTIALEKRRAISRTLIAQKIDSHKEKKVPAEDSHPEEQGGEETTSEHEKIHNEEEHSEHKESEHSEHEEVWFEKIVGWQSIFTVLSLLYFSAILIFVPKFLSEGEQHH